MKLIALALAFALSLSLHASEATEELFDNPCELTLTGLFLKASPFLRGFFRKLYDNYTIHEFPDKTGFELKLKNSSATRLPELVDFTSDPDPLKFWSSQEWLFDDIPFQFIDVGFKNLQYEVNKINYLVIQWISNKGEDLVVRYSPQWLKARQTLKPLRWTLHKSVLEKYKVRKPYLDSVQIEDLNLPNTVSGNSDVFGLLLGLPKPVADLRVDDIRSRLVLTAQITYHGDRHFQQPPSLRGLYASAGYIVDEDLDKFPFEYRIAGPEFEKFREKFYSRFPVRTTCEVNRYAMFVKKLPTEVHERFLYHIFKTAENRGMKAMIAEADRKTARLFERYGFKVFAEMPSVQSDETEYVVYVERGSPEWKKTMARFAENIDRVHVEKLEPR